MKANSEVRKVLAAAQCEGPLVRVGPIADHLWERVDTVLRAAGAHWSHRHRCYQFPDLFPGGDAAPLVGAIVAEGRTRPRPNRGIVSCPPEIAERMVQEAGIRPDMEVLEPSAGHGVLAAEIAATGAAVDCIELDPARATDIDHAGFARNVLAADFLTLPPRPSYDAVLLYPPHRLQLAAAHIVHAHQWLRPGGTVIALTSPKVQLGQQRASTELRDLGERYGLSTDELDRGEVVSLTGRQGPSPRRTKPRTENGWTPLTTGPTRGWDRRQDGRVPAVTGRGPICLGFAASCAITCRGPGDR